MIVGYSDVMNFNEKIPTNFKKQIEAGQKIHTFRRIKKRMYEVGDKLHQAINPLTTEQQTFSLMICTGVQKALFDFSSYPKNKQFTLKIDDKQLSNEEIEKVAINDGFANASLFAQWFWHTAEKAATHKLDMQLVHWTNLVY